MRLRLRSAFSILATVLFFWTVAAEAYDQQVTSALWAEGYSVSTPGGNVISRRRFVEDLRLGAWNLIPGSDQPYYRGPRLSIELALLLDTDFAVGTKESSSSSELNYVPGLTPIQMDITQAHLHARGLWNDTLDVRAGRQIRMDTLGFFAFDGVETRLHLPIGLGLDTYLGYEVRGGQILGYDALELDGTDNGGRHDMEADRYPDRTEPASRLAIGTELSFSPWHWFDTAVSFRAVGLSEPLADEQIGGRFGLGDKPVRADGRIIWSPLADLVSEVDAEIAVTPWNPIVVSIDYHLFRPVFEGDSIFNVFDLSSQNDLGGRVDVRFNQKLIGAVWGFIRLADQSAGIDGEASDALAAGAGGGLGANYRTPVRELSARVSLHTEWGESRIGGEIGGGQALFPGQRLWLRFRSSVWYIEDAFSEFLSGNLAGYVLSANFRIADGAHLLGEFEHYVGSGQDQRFIALALLQLDLWR
ncbi:MAG: hypothetical protein GY847_03550 [Proteobacteria bacterium]|nr:hypothetical protein [Pseudomonadota bacterium]